MPARSMSSYSEALFTILDEFKPARIFEWGPGSSTQIMAMQESTKSLKSVEHEEMFYKMLKRLNLPNTELVLRSNMDEYVREILGESYDFVFVDGRDRSRCLNYARMASPIVMLHDAARADYREAIKMFNYAIWVDDGNTVILTDFYEIVGRCLHSLGVQVCGEPKPERVTMLVSEAI